MAAEKVKEVKAVEDELSASRPPCFRTTHAESSSSTASTSSTFSAAIAFGLEGTIALPKESDAEKSFETRLFCVRSYVAITRRKLLAVTRTTGLLYEI